MTLRDRRIDAIPEALALAQGQAATNQAGEPHDSPLRGITTSAFGAGQVIAG